MYTLFIDTHSKNVVIILFKNKHFFVKKDIITSNRHSEVTMPIINEVFKEANITLIILIILLFVMGLVHLLENGLLLPLLRLWLIV